MDFGQVEILVFVLISSLNCQSKHVAHCPFIFWCQHCVFCG